MKHLLVIIAICLGIGTNSFGQNSNTPIAVQNAFKTKFQDTRKVKWELEKEGEWEANFHQAGHEMSALFNTSGTWLETEMEIRKDDLPMAIKNAISSQFKGYSIDEAAKINASDGTTSYEAELEKGESNIEVLFSEDGQIISQKMIDEKENKS